MTAPADPKSEVLRAHATLNPHPEQVTDALFQSQPFFDARDLLQVKYEMLRRVLVEGQPVGATAAAFGFSRVTLYQLRKRFETQGLAGLLPQRKGPQRSHKLSDEILSFVQQTLAAEPALRVADLPQRVAERFGLSIHLRSIERALARERKKTDRPVSVTDPARWQRRAVGVRVSGWLRKPSTSDVGTYLYAVEPTGNHLHRAPGSGSLDGACAG